jgi:hypothetical protein
MKNHLNNCPKCESPLMITRYDCNNCGTSVEGEFTGCPFCRLDDEDRLFALVFIQTEGNMKDVERLMSISYPTIKARLARLNNALAGGRSDYEMLRESIAEQPVASMDPALKADIMNRLASGELTAAAASRLLRGEPVDGGGDTNEKEDDGND